MCWTVACESVGFSFSAESGSPSFATITNTTRLTATSTGMLWRKRRRMYVSTLGHGQGAHVHPPALPPQHPRARRGEPRRVRDGREARRSALGAEAEPDALAGDRPAHRAREAPRRERPRPVRLLG